MPSPDLLDLNVWLALLWDGHGAHRVARGWFDDNERPCAFCRVTQMGLLRLLTQRKIMGADVLGQKRSWSIYGRAMDHGRVMFVDEPVGVEQAWRKLTSRRTSSHALWTDAYLAAFASSSEMRLVTFDTTLGRIGGVETLLLATDGA